MRKLYVRRFAILIARLSSNACRGCRVDHPRQLQHDECLLRKETLVDRLFKEAVSSIKRSDIVTAWQNIVKRVTVHLPDEGERHAVFPWLYADGASSTWIDDVKKRVVFRVKSGHFTFSYGCSM